MSFGGNLSHLLDIDDSENNFQEQSTEKDILQSFSDEQKDIIGTMGNNNAYVNAVAGSGKTTTILGIATSYPNKQILQLTYNSELKAEVRKKVRHYELQNIQVDSYHSLVVRYYDQKGYTDAVMRDIINNNKPPAKKLRQFNIIVVDEAQDMKLIFFQLVRKFMYDMRGDPQLLILGDERQSVYGFIGADHRFLTLSDQLWKSSRNMISHSLSTSYRVTKPIAWFVNQIMYGQDILTSNKEGDPIDYIYCNSYKAGSYIVPYLTKILRSGEIKPEDIFVLAPSVKSGDSPTRKLEHTLVKKNIPCHLSTSDEKKLDEGDIAGKVVFTTFHKAKGRERPIVIIYGFDSYYYELYKKDSPPNICTNELYVACTRASKKLMLIHDCKNGTMPFLLLNEFKEKSKKNPCYIRFLGELFDYPTTEIIRYDEHRSSATELIKFLKDQHLKIIAPLIEDLFSTIENSYYSVNIPNKIMNDQKLCEDVSDLNGLTIPAMFEMEHTGETALFEHLGRYSGGDVYFKNAIEKIRYPCQTISDYLYLANVYSAVTENVHYRINQIYHFNWMLPDMVSQCHTHMGKYLAFESKITFEKQLGYTHKHQKYGLIELECRLDAVDDHNIWEFKCVNSLQIDHLLQLVVYAWMWDSAGSSPRKFFIMNIRTGETLELKTSKVKQINKVIELIFKNKYDKIDEFNDEEFIIECKKQTEKLRLSPEISVEKLSSSNIYSDMTLEKLKKMCKEKNIKGYSKKKKNGIIDLLISYDNNKPENIKDLLNTKQ